MIINKRKQKIPHKFEGLKNGDVFLCMDEAYMKIESIENTLSGDVYNAVNLDCGTLKAFDVNEGVYKKENAALELG